MEIDHAIRIWIRHEGYGSDNKYMDQAVNFGDRSGNKNLDQAVWSKIR
jgi:hypothetical protein